MEVSSTRQKRVYIQGGEEEEKIEREFKYEIKLSEDERLGL